jgi:putative PEP-CTERM system integral membrane protein
MITGQERLKKSAQALTFCVQIIYLIFLFKIALIVLIPVLPGIVGLMKSVPTFLLDSRMIASLLMIVVVLGPIALLVFFLTVFPTFALTCTSLLQLKESFHTVKSRIGVAQSTGIIGLAILAFVGIRQIALIQPQEGVFELLDKDFNEPSGKRLLSDQEGHIRRGLLNAYLSSYRYLTDQTRPPNVGQTYSRYIETVGRKSEERINHFYNGLIAEFIYQGDRNADSALAEQWYLRFFDKDMQEAERSAINTALRSSLFSGESAGGLIDIDAENVLLRKQQIEITEADDLAEITVHESYSSESVRIEEVVYHFALPEDTALTGLWLSDGSNPEKKFAFRISPRGAAQSVYNSIVAERQDPALLEQVGPNIYRLRVFPITQTNVGRAAERVDMHMWFSYVAAPDATGNWPVPQLIERRNVYWDDRTERTVNGQTVKNSDDWFTKFSVKPSHKASELEFLWNRYKVSRSLLTDENSLAAGKIGPVAVIIDTSRSMKEYLPGIRDQLPRYSQYNLEFFTLDNGKLVLHGSPKSGELQLSAFGRSSINQLIDAYQENNKNYSALLILTDEGNYDEKWLLRGNLPPTFIIHYGQKHPRDYGDDLSVFLMTSGNGIAFSIDEALKRLTVIERLSETNDSSYFRITENSIWRFAEQKEGVDPRQKTLKPSAPMQALAAKELIPYLAHSRKEVDSKVKVEALNRVHEQAIQNGIVTLFSSMIVLVNDRQQKALDEAETKSNKFERKTETGIEALQGMVGSISATPEPHEWVLFGLVMIALLVFLKKQDLRPVLALYKRK